MRYKRRYIFVVITLRLLVDRKAEIQMPLKPIIYEYFKASVLHVRLVFNEGGKLGVFPEAAISKQKYSS
jgi:hypothetical protein